MTYLLDVNVLIALVDPRHIFHDTANEWFQVEAVGSWATCPITENGLVRIVGSGRYPNPVGPPAEIVEILKLLRAMPGHVFWPDAVSLADNSRIDAVALIASERVTDAYLLALAVAPPSTGDWRPTPSGADARPCISFPRPPDLSVSAGPFGVEGRAIGPAGEALGNIERRSLAQGAQGAVGSGAVDGRRLWIDQRRAARDPSFRRQCQLHLDT